MIVSAAVALCHLRRDGTSLILDWRDGGVPVVVHWGDDLGALTDAAIECLADAGWPAIDLAHGFAKPARPRLLMLESDAWKGRPGLAGHRIDGSAWSPAVRMLEVSAPTDARPSERVLRVAAGAVRFALVDAPAALNVVIEVEMVAGGVARLRAEVETGEDYLLEELALALPVPQEASELLDFSGRWSRERAAFRMPLGPQAHVHESREGRPGFDAAPMLICGRPGFDFAQGSVFGVHVGWSGNQRSWAERDASGTQVLAGGELMLPGEIRLSSGESYRSPWVYFARGEGLDNLAHRVHAWVRSQPGHPSTARPVTLNVWEAVYFAHDLARLIELAEVAASLGVERFVLDDGWFLNRRSDHAGLGDWVVDSAVWPDGLHPLVDRVRELGMEFGLWVEPEMVNPDSDLARAHPDWILASAEALPVSWRHQQAVNLAHPDAYAHVFGQLRAVLEEYEISYLKWDHNRPLVSAGDARARGRASVHEQTLACYRLMDELAGVRAGLELESCASGGGRIDLGMAERVQRFWPSDCLDPLERQDIMRWTAQLVPLEMLGAHVAGPVSRSTGRTSSLAFRAAGALFGHFGIEWDLTTATEAEREQLMRWVQFYRANREWLSAGLLYRRDVGDGTMALRGLVERHARRALFELSRRTRGTVSPVGRVQFPGLNPESNYRVRALDPDRVEGLVLPDWGNQDLVLPGAALAAVGIAAPEMFPEQSLLFDVEEVSPLPRVRAL